MLSPRRLLATPRGVLGGLIVVQWILTGALAASVRHNGWVFYQGGDQIWYVTSGWLLGMLELPVPLVSGGWPLLLAPITWLTGATYVSALPFVLLVNVLVLAPLGLLAVYGLASEIAGRLFGYWCAALWVVVPFGAIPLFVDRYHERYVDQFLPQGLGLTALADFPSMVFVLCAAYLVLRSIREATLWSAVTAGLVAGYAGWTKPPNLLFVAGAVLAYVVARRWRELVAFGLAILPALLVLTIWKYRGFGSLPVLAYEQTHSATGLAVSIDSVDKYLKLDGEHWGRQMAELREYFWSARLAQWAPFAGAIALLRVAPVAAALTAGWLAAFLVVKGTYEFASIEAGSFFRLLMPAWPAYLILFAAIPLLVPGALRRLRSRGDAAFPAPISRRAAVAAGAILGGLPLVVVGLAQPIDGPKRAVLQTLTSTELLTPVVADLALTVEPRGVSRIIRWQPYDRRDDVFYRVYRTALAGEGVECVVTGAAKCYLTMLLIGSTSGTSIVDGSPPPGVTYRLGVGTNWLNDPAFGDVFAIGPPARG